MQAVNASKHRANFFMRGGNSWTLHAVDDHGGRVGDAGGGRAKRRARARRAAIVRALAERTAIEPEAKALTSNLFFCTPDQNGISTEKLIDPIAGRGYAHAPVTLNALHRAVCGDQITLSGFIRPAGSKAPLISRISLWSSSGR